MSQQKDAARIEVVNPNAAGLDIGSREIFAALPPDRESEIVRAFGTFTPDLQQLADWLNANGVDTVAMESTGVYWIPVFELLEARGFRVYLVNGRHVKNVPGRKSDVQDCQWLQKLHAFGLLSSSFRPDGDMCALRAYLRHRTELLQHRASHILHMQKALQQMNIQLSHVLADITGETGMTILRAIVAGERDSVKLAQFRSPRCKSPEETIAKALLGNWKEEHLFALKQALELYDFYTTQIAACDAQVEKFYGEIKPRWDFDALDFDAVVNNLPHKTRQKNAPASDVRAEIVRLTGVDLVAVPGIGGGLAQTILSEIGTDMSKWPTHKHFASWCGLSPHNDISGGKVLHSKTLPTRNRAGQAFRQAAMAASKSNTVFGAFYRRKRAKSGPLYAQVATAHKIARTIYYMLKYHVQFDNTSADEYERKQHERELVALKKKAAKLGLTLVAPQSTNDADGGAL